MNKSVIMFCMSVGSVIGGYLPWLLGDHDLMSPWVFLGGLIGGIVGIWIGVKVTKLI